jgi:hypothetical protein
MLMTYRAALLIQLVAALPRMPSAMPRVIQ